MSIKHSELLMAENKTDFCHGVEIDKAPDSFAFWLKEIGIISKISENGNDFDVIDSCIGYIANNVNVILEVPFEQDFDEKSLFMEAMVTGYDLSILPPYFEGEERLDQEKEKKSWEKYSNKLCEYVRIWLDSPNNNQTIYPVSGFFSYMVSEVFGYKPDSITKDSYIESVYVKNIPLEIMDEIKEKLRLVIYESFDGKDNFESYVHSLAKAIVDDMPKKKD